MEEQLKVAERRFGDVERRLHRKLHLLQTTHQGAESATVDIALIRQWVAEKTALVREKEPLGFRAKSAETKLQQTKVNFKNIFHNLIRNNNWILNSSQGLCKEVEMQQLVIENLELRVSNIASDLDADEQAQLRADLKSLSGEYRTLCQGVRTYEQELDKAVSDRQQFEALLDDTQRKLAALVVQSQGYELLPLTSAATEKLAEKFKVLLKPHCFSRNKLIKILLHLKALKQSVVDFEGGELNDFKKQVQNILKSCNESAKSELQEISQGKFH